MRLPQPFIRLPLRVDAAAIAAEISALDEDAWRAHPQGAPGNTAVPLVAAGGNPDDDSTIGPMRPTSYLGVLPYTQRVLAGLDAVIGRTRLMRIAEETELAAHVDTNYYWWEHLRVHIPILTTPDVRFACDGTTVHMDTGDVWVFDTWRAHRVLNPAGTSRVHLVVDTVGSPSLWEMIEQPDREARRIDPREGPASVFVTETFNHPTVMSPWELERTLDSLSSELDSADPVSSRFAAILLPLRHAWRTAWAIHGDGPSGWHVFDSLRSDADAVLEPLSGTARLPNGVDVAEAIRQLVLRPALNPSVATPPARAVAGSGARRPASRLEIDQPIFVVSAPRAGSTLLFETLARAPDLFTIGGESHRVIEALPRLRPGGRGWDSNRLDATDATPDVVAELQRSFAALLRDRDGRPSLDGATRMLEKTPKNALRVPFLAEAFPDATFVYLYRDPRETVSSMLDAWRSGRFVTYPNLPDWDGPPWSLVLVPGWRELAGRSLAEIVTTQWATTTEALLDDLEALDPDRWCVASYDRLVAEPAAEIERLCTFLDIAWDVELTTPLPDSRHTLDSPSPEKWRRNAHELEPQWQRVRETAARAHAVFAAPPRIKPVRAVEREQRPAPAAGEPFRSVHAAGFAELLRALESSLLVSTYQTGRVIALRADGDRLNTHFRAFSSAMGMARRGALLAIGTKTDVQVLQDQPAMTSRLEPPGRHDACYMPRRAHTTGDIRIHDLGFAGSELWIVNTTFSCLATLDDIHSFVPRWRPPFVTALAPEDRCHLNGLAIVDDVPKFVTALGATDAAGGWREGKVDGGVVLDVATGDAVVSGLCMPHSPRWHDGRLWVLESGRGSLGVVDLDAGTVEDVAVLPGFTRGLALAGPYAFVGLSQVRENLFDGLPLTAPDAVRTCGVWVVDVRTGETVSFLRFEDAVQELFEVTVLAGVRFPEIVEPGAELVNHSYVLPDAALADVPPDLRTP